MSRGNQSEHAIRQSMDFHGNKNSEGPVRILVVGASGRMTAAMLCRLGYACSVADFFADRDTKMICDGRVTKLSRLHDLHLHEQLVRSHDFVVFAGGLEGNVEVAEKIAQWTGRLFAAPPSVGMLNDYAVLNEALKTSGLDRFPFQRNPMKVKLPAIAKSLHGSGRAFLVRHWLDCLKGIYRGRVFQNAIEGDAVSQVFVGDGHSVKVLGGSTLLNQTMSWVGSVSGLMLTEPDQEASLRLANNLVELTGIEGVFGIDFVRNDDGLWPIDFNPRIPASAEIVGDHVMREHMVSFGLDAVSLPEAEETKLVQGKIVVCNTTVQPLRFELNKLPDLPFRHQSSYEDTSIADIPTEGEVIKSGRPILTVFVSGESEQEVQTLLRQNSYEIQHWLSP